MSSASRSGTPGPWSMTHSRTVSPAGACPFSARSMISPLPRACRIAFVISLSSACSRRSASAVSGWMFLSLSTTIQVPAAFASAAWSRAARSSSGSMTTGAVSMWSVPAATRPTSVTSVKKRSARTTAHRMADR